MNPDIKKLNLGCGKFPKKGYINLDIDKDGKADIIHNLDNYPWPLPDSHFEIIEMDHILEHLTDLRNTFCELNRIMALNGRLYIRVPHFSRGFTHWDHKHGFDVTFPIYFSDELSGGFRSLNFKHVSTKLIWFGQDKLKKQHLSPILYYVGKKIGIIFDFIGNINHYFSSRFLCYWIGGYDEIQFVFKKD